MLKNQLTSVSVVINCHNSEKFIEECLASVMNQSYKDFEVIVWDNKSDDLTEDIVRKSARLDSRIKYFRGENFVPLGSARNLALEKCDGNWIAFLDSDDLWDHDFLTDQMSALAGKESSTFGYGFVTEFLQNSAAIQNFGKEERKMTPGISSYKKLLSGNFLYFSSLIFSREALDFLKNFKEEFVQAEDYELLLRLSEKFQAIQTGHVYYRLHENNLSKSQTAELYTETLLILENHKDNFSARLFSALNLINLGLLSIKKRDLNLFRKIKSRVKINLFYLFLGIGLLIAQKAKKNGLYALSRTLNKVNWRGK